MTLQLNSLYKLNVLSIDGKLSFLECHSRVNVVPTVLADIGPATCGGLGGQLSTFSTVRRRGKSFSRRVTDSAVDCVNGSDRKTFVSDGGAEPTGGGSKQSVELAAGID
ncbi:hypothetical protein [Natrialba swarupiae]|uniref:Uncharacterized protein n=1 Tax=Natrialba swarupiae TaxID=2448032 RepID=A0A5D5AGF4_9EURY|nr:hypothetical protein [Natrialba swarupiae]TYT60898.1 hypothetical protein FYC77_16405 [Natrialba swarupiae]